MWIAEKLTGRSRHRWQPAGFRGQRGYLVLQVEVKRTYDISSPHDPGATSEDVEWIDAQPEHLTESKARYDLPLLVRLLGGEADGNEKQPG